MKTEDILDELRRKSIQILEFIFQSTRGDIEKYIKRDDIAKAMDFSESEINAVLSYLCKENFIAFDTLLGLTEPFSIIYITINGIDRIDSLYSEKSEYENLLKKQEEDLNRTNNQGINALHAWNGFYFRSQTEIKIAEALDSAGVLFYPNCKARMNSGETRVNKESDFLVFWNGKFGILEVDGRPYHQTAADDHERDRLFKRYGIRVIERFDAQRCWNDPGNVVEEFLEIINQS